MTQRSIEALSLQLQLPISKLLEELERLGFKKSATDQLSPEEYARFMALRPQAVQRKHHMTLKVTGQGGKRSVVTIEVRKKRIYIPASPEAVPVSEARASVLEERPTPETEVSAVPMVAPEERVAPSPVRPSRPISTEKVSVKKERESLKPKADKTDRRKEKDEWQRLQALKKTLSTQSMDALGSEQLDEVFEEVLDSTPKRSHKFSEPSSPRKGSKKSLASKSALHQKFIKPVGQVGREIQMHDGITVGDLAAKLSIKASELIKTLMRLGVVATINQRLEAETAQLAASYLGHTLVVIAENALEQQLTGSYTSHSEQHLKVLRAPVVTIMGHVDHGKTSLLDYIRTSRLASKEAGGITQRLGAYPVTLPSGSITFLDTPGHVAFTAMRARGAQITDIVVLVVAADDGVMPQTIEAIQHAKAAGVPMVVAVNKIDKPDAHPERIQEALLQHEVVSEVWGGSTQFVKVSAKTGEGIDALLNAILVQAELLELKVAATGPAQGVILESHMHKGYGPVATVLVQQGTLQAGESVLCGQVYGKVRAMQNAAGVRITTATPSMPIALYGLSGLPEVGERLWTVLDERKARLLATQRSTQARADAEQRPKVNLETLFSHLQKDQAKAMMLNIVLKADMQGTLQALSEALRALSTPEVQVVLRGHGVGEITETDVHLASASNAILIAFNVRPDPVARQMIEAERIELRSYTVIYEVLDDVKQAMSGILAPEIIEVLKGAAEIRAVFNSKKFGVIAGCFVKEGSVKRHLPVRLSRQGSTLYEGELDSLRRGKEDVQEVRAGTECGMGFKTWADFQVGDLIEVYERVEKRRVIA